jgi:hypothetical protein
MDDEGKYLQDEKHIVKKEDAMKYHWKIIVNFGRKRMDW